MEVSFFIRNISAGYSHSKVFTPIINTIQQKYPTAKVYEMPYVGGSFKEKIRNILFTYKSRNKNGVNHLVGGVSYCFLALLSSKSVITVHDTYVLDHTKNPLKKFFINAIWNFLPMLFTDKTTCISEETAKRLKKHTPRFLHKKIVVINNPVDSNLQYAEANRDQTIPTILHLGTKSNKNLERVAEALKGIPCTLNIIGKLSESQIKALKESAIQYTNSFNLTDEEINEAYKDCDIVSFASLYEGFGMPIIEGQAVGRPVVTSNIEPMLGIANDSAIIVDPYDVQSIRNGFLQLIEDNSLYDEIVQKGRKNVENYSVAAISKEYSSLYQELLGKAK